MSTSVKMMAAFAAGIGCGVLATYSFFKKKYSTIAEEEISAMEAVLHEKKPKEEKEQKEGWKNPVVEFDKRSNELTNYNKMTENYISSVPPGENEIEQRIEHMHQKAQEELEHAEAEHPREESGEQYQISSMDWLDDPFYDKVELTYYVGDDTVANEVGQIDDIDMSIGMDEFERFKNSDDNERYIRNPALGIDYNIIKDMGCYHV